MNRRYDSIWDAIEDTPAASATMKSASMARMVSCGVVRIAVGPAMLQAAGLCRPRGLPWVVWRVLLQELGGRRRTYERLRDR